MPCSTLGQIIEESDLSRVDILIVDVEGYDSEVVRQMDIGKVPEQDGILGRVDQRQAIGEFRDRSKQVKSTPTSGFEPADFRTQRREETATGRAAKGDEGVVDQPSGDPVRASAGHMKQAGGKPGIRSLCGPGGIQFFCHPLPKGALFDAGAAGADRVSGNLVEFAEIVDPGILPEKLFKQGGSRIARA